MDTSSTSRAFATDCFVQDLGLYSYFLVRALAYNTHNTLVALIEFCLIVVMQPPNIPSLRSSASNLILHRIAGGNIVRACVCVCVRGFFLKN